MKLREKSQIDRGRAVEQQQEIDRGLKLAKRVDELRVEKAKEETDLKNWREKTLQITQSEIDTKIVERDALTKQNEALVEERLRLQAPIDLTKEWGKVNKDRLDIEKWKRELFEREASVINRELLLQELPEREKKIVEKEKQADLYLTETNQNYDKVETIRKDLEARKREAEGDIQTKYSALQEREKDVAARENNLGKERIRLSNEAQELLTRGTGFIARESTIEAKEKEFVDREETLRENENLTQRYLQEAKSNYDKTEKSRVSTENAKEVAEKDIESKYRALLGKQKELALKEHDVHLEKENVDRAWLQIADERLHITSQQETLKLAWAQIKKLQGK